MRTLLIHENLEDANASGVTLKAMGRAARTLLEECIEHQGVQRKTLSKAAESLNKEGFIFIRGEKHFSDDAYTLSPSLAGEEALEALEEMEDKKILS
jgi:DNA-binding MarR family transcriptional regulator